MRLTRTEGRQKGDRYVVSPDCVPTHLNVFFFFFFFFFFDNVILRFIYVSRSNYLFIEIRHRRRGTKK